MATKWRGREKEKERELSELLREPYVIRIKQVPIFPLEPRFGLLDSKNSVDVIDTGLAVHLSDLLSG